MNEQTDIDRMQQICIEITTLNNDLIETNRRIEICAKGQESIAEDDDESDRDTGILFFLVKKKGDLTLRLDQLISEIIHIRSFFKQSQN